MLHRRDITFTKASIFRPGIGEYAERHVSPLPMDLCDLMEATHSCCPEWAGIASSGSQVWLLKTLVRVARARRILEVGTFTGHAAVGMAAELPETGRVVTVDNFSADDRARTIAREAFARSPHGHKIQLIEGDAFAALGNVEGEFDIVFVDADKPNYIGYYECILQRKLLHQEGLLVFDNTLWGGTVLDPPAVVPSLEDATGAEWMSRMIAGWSRHVADFNEHVLRDARVTSVLLTVRDGMTLITHARPEAPVARNS